MIRVSLRVYAELAAFLPPARRQRTVELALRERDTVKDVIEAQGVPHTEVDVVVVNGEPVDFGYRVSDGDRIAVFPAFRTLDLGSLRHAGPPPLLAPRFVLDVHLGALAALLRLVGFDTLYRNDYDDPTLARISAAEQRILLTRDRGLLKRSLVTYGCHVWATDPEQQLEEVLRRFKLAGAAAPFSRCLRCNGEIEHVDKADVRHRLEPKTNRYFQQFAVCRACDQVYWQGSHHHRMRRLVEEVLARVDSPVARSSSMLRAEAEPAPAPANTRRQVMRFMVMVKANKDSEAGVMPSTEMLAAMGKYNEELVKAGVMLAGEGLQPSSKGAKVKFSGTQRTVIDGPFAEAKELIAGFWLIQVRSKEEAIEWVKRCPNPFEGESEIEIRQVFEAEDFGPQFTPELRAQEERQRAQMADRR